MKKDVVLIIISAVAWGYGFYRLGCIDGAHKTIDALNAMLAQDDKARAPGPMGQAPPAVEREDY